MNQELKQICNHYGLSQLDVCQEELAELIQAISKYKRYGSSSETIYHIEEEIADVEIMIAQTMMIIGSNKRIIESIKNEKIERQLKRIKQENEPIDKHIDANTDNIESTICHYGNSISKYFEYKGVQKGDK